MQEFRFVPSGSFKAQTFIINLERVTERQRHTGSIVRKCACGYGAFYKYLNELMLLITLVIGPFTHSQAIISLHSATIAAKQLPHFIRNQITRVSLGTNANYARVICEIVSLKFRRCCLPTVKHFTNETDTTRRIKTLERCKLNYALNYPANGLENGKVL